MLAIFLGYSPVSHGPDLSLCLTKLYFLLCLSKYYENALNETCAPLYRQSRDPPPMNVFEITVRRRQADGWPVTAEYSRPGELARRAEGTLRLPEDYAVELRMLHLDAHGYGTLLGKALFQGTVLLKFMKDFPFQKMTIFHERTNTVKQMTDIESSAKADRKVSLAVSSTRTLLIFILISCSVIVSGCVYLRLFKVIRQFKQFDKYVMVDKEDGLTFSFLRPILYEDDIKWLGLSPVSQNNTSGVTSWKHILEKEYNNQSEQGNYDIVFNTRYQNEKLHSIYLSERY
ncbi:MAG: hypothetical protein D3909_12035, partial [Candidatus Electrothrix sp. ATG1]|nr:hypothetical protein [Candidatus Electrothrix sp. ATG1]